MTGEYVAWLNDPNVVGETEQSGQLHDESSVKGYIEQTLAAPDAIIWRILHRDRHVGNIRLSAIHAIHRRASVGIIIGPPDIRGRGVGSRSIALTTDYAFEVLELNKVFAGLYASNIASRKAFEKAGYSLEATLHAHAWHRTQFVDVYYMARFRKPIVR